MTPDEHNQCVAIIGYEHREHSDTCHRIAAVVCTIKAEAIRAALRERDAEWAAALRLSHYDSIDGPHMAYTTPAGEWLGCNECAPLCALLEEAGK